MKGIILAGGEGSRLYPLTKFISKQLLPVYDKPLIYYPISTLMLAGIRDILIITSPKNYHDFYELLGDGSQWGVSFSYAIQKESKGIAEAFIIGEKFINNEPCCLMLGDNILYGAGNINLLRKSAKSFTGAQIFCLSVSDPQRYGIATFDKNNKVIDLEEKPENPKSNSAVIGLYFYDNQVVDIAKSIKPSKRGELEITDVNKVYLSQNQLYSNQLGRGVAWFDAGTHHSLVEAAHFIKIIEEQQGLKIACCEEIAYLMKYITLNELKILAMDLKKTSYGEYLNNIIENPQIIQSEELYAVR